MVHGPRQATMWLDFRPVRKICVCVGGTYILTRAFRVKVVGVPYLLSRSSVVVAKKVLCDKAMWWKAWMEMRRAAAKASGETEVAVYKSGEESSGLRGRIAGSGGPNGDLGGAPKSISKGESWARVSWGTEL